MSTRPSRASYSRVSQSDSAETREYEDDDARQLRLEQREERRKLRKERVEYYSTKLHAILWVMAAVAVTYYTDLPNVIVNGTNKNTIWFGFGVTMFTLSSTLVLYMAFWVPLVRKIKLEPAVYHPGLIEFTTIVSVLCALGLNVGLWPTYGVFTPGILGTIWFGSIMLAHFLPAM